MERGCLHNGCSTYSVYGRDRGRASDYRRGDRRGCRVDVPDRGRELHSSPRAWYRTLIGVAVVVGLVFVSGPATAAYPSPLTPPGGTAPYMDILHFPDCGDIKSGTTVLDRAVGLGWRGTRTGIFTHPPSGVGTPVVAVPSIPCLTGSLAKSVSFVWGIQMPTGTTPLSALTGDAVVTAECASDSSGMGAASYTFGVGSPSEVSGSPAGMWAQFSTVLLGSGTARPCAFLKSLKMTVKEWSTVDVRINTTWLPKYWDSTDGDWSADEGSIDPYFEAAIVCELGGTSSDFLTWAGELVTSLVGYIPCMLTPKGWDRSGRLADTWNESAFVAVPHAVESAIPGSIACGVVGTIPFFGNTVTLDSCDADVAPLFVKTGVAWVIILGLWVTAVYVLLRGLSGSGIVKDRQLSD